MTWPFRGKKPALKPITLEDWKAGAYQRAVVSARKAMRLRRCFPAVRAARQRAAGEG